MNNNFINQAITNLLPLGHNGFSIIDEDVSSIDWFDNADYPSVTEITAEISRLQAEYDANQYQRDRANAYPSLQDQADMQFHDAVDGTTTWQDAIQGVKDTYPKPI